MWKNIEINLQNIEYDTGKASLIKMPNKSKYAGYKFWYPNKLIRYGSNSYARNLGYTDEFIFKLKKYSKGKYNSRKIINELEISAEEFGEAFGYSIDDANSQEAYLHIIEPQKIEKDIEIKEELKNESN